MQQLALFVRTVETGSFSRAAREFSLSQPSASRAVAALEERLGVKLLVRTTRQVALTDAGEVLLAKAREVLVGLDEAENAARGADTVSGTLRVALPTTYGVRQIVPLLPAFLEAHPDLKIDLMMSDRYENLVAEGVDLALRLGEQPDSSFVSRKLASARRLFVAAPAYLGRRGAPRTLSDLARHDLVAGPGDPGERRWLAWRGDTAEAVSVDPRLFTRSAAGLVAVTLAGLGIGIASAWMCRNELAEGQLVEVLGDYRLEPISAFIIFPAGRRPSRRARAFSDYLEATLVREG